MEEFLRAFASRSGWTAPATDRLVLVGEETIASLLSAEGTDLGDDESETYGNRRLIVTARNQGGGAELEFVSAAEGENLEDQLAHLSEPADVVDGREISFRILRHYASAVRHQKYHGVDIVTDGPTTSCHTTLEPFNFREREKRTVGGIEMVDQMEQPGVTGETLVQAGFDDRYIPYVRWLVTIYLFITGVGILLIPFWWLFSMWYGPEYMRRVSARLTTAAMEIRKGVFTRSEATIPLNRITDVRVHDGPLMRHYTLRGLKVETAGQGGGPGASESNLISVIDAVEFRDAILRQRQQVLGGETSPPASGTSALIATDTSTTAILTEIRDILARMEAKGS